MRPAKRILVVARDEQMASRMRFVLWVWNYDAHTTLCPAEALRRIGAAPGKWDALLVEYPQHFEMQSAGVAMAVFGEKLSGFLPSVQEGGTVRTDIPGGMMRLLREVKWAATGKRGPKKKACVSQHPSARTHVDAPEMAC
jgi:hypothetical protein